MCLVGPDPGGAAATATGQTSSNPLRPPKFNGEGLRIGEESPKSRRERARFGRPD